LTAMGLTDIKASPIESTYPAVGVQSNIINSILTNQYVREASRPWNTTALIVIGVLSSFLFIFSRQILSFVMGLALGGFWILFTYWLFVDQSLWVFVMNPLLLIFSLFIFSAVFSMTVGQKERQRLFTLATRDGLTGLYVIRHFRLLLNDAVVEANRKKTLVSVILLDLDFFKKINDKYGHIAGDAVLRHVSNAIQTTVKIEGDTKEMNAAGRYGGEEFIVLLKNCRLVDAAFNYGEKIRRKIEQDPFIYEGVKIPLTVSLGVSVLHPDETVPDIMVYRADEALYRAKEEGRNRVCIETDHTAGSIDKKETI